MRVPRVACASGRLVYGAAVADVALGRAVDIVRREEFDADLVAQARARGIEVVEGEGVERFQVDGAARQVRIVTTRGRDLRARDPGRRRRRRQPRAQGAGPGGSGAAGARASAARCACSRPSWRRRRRLQLGGRMIYDFSPMDEGLRGYVWLFPVAGGRVNVGAMHYPSRHLPGAEIDRLLRRTLASYGVNLTAPARGWPAWRYDPRARIAGPHLTVRRRRRRHRRPDR